MKWINIFIISQFPIPQETAAIITYWKFWIHNILSLTMVFMLFIRSFPVFITHIASLCPLSYISPFSHPHSKIHRCIIFDIFDLPCPAICSNTDEPRGCYLSEISQTERKKKTLHDLIYLWNVRKVNLKFYKNNDT